MMNRNKRNDLALEITRITHAAQSGATLAELLKRYHERDVAKAAALLTEQEREREPQRPEREQERWFAVAAAAGSKKRPGKRRRRWRG